MSDFAFDTRTLAVQIQMGGPPFEAELFLPASDPYREHGLLARLADRDRFLPSRSRGGIRLLAKSSIRWIFADSLLPELEEAASFGAREVETKVVLEDGSSHRGRVAILLPELRGRLLDHLNQPEPFLALLSGSGTLVLNKSWIRSVVPGKSA